MSTAVMVSVRTEEPVRMIIIVTSAFASQGSQEDTAKFSRTGVPAPRVKMADSAVLCPLVMSVSVYTDTQESAVRSRWICAIQTHVRIKLSVSLCREIFTASAQMNMRERHAVSYETTARPALVQ